MLHRYNITNPDGKTLSIVAKSAAQAKGKAWIRFIAGAKFLHYGPAQLQVEKLEAVNGPELMEAKP